MPKVSIIVPTYNVEKYLEECLESIINQTLHDIEIICVNDGSTDNSQAILNKYGEKDKRIKIINKENGGYGKAMNTGISLATGEYIGIVEPDDYIQPDMYEILYNKAKELDLDIIKSDFYSFKTVNNKKKLTYVKLDKTNSYYNKLINLKEDFAPFKFRIYTWCGIYKRSLLNDNNFKYNETPGASYQDNGCFFLTLCFAKKIYFMDKPLYMYRCDNPVSSVKNKGKAFILQNEYNFILNELKKRHLDNNQIMKLFYFKKYMSYKFNYLRIDKLYKNDFLKAFSEEFSIAEQNGDIDYSLFEKNDRKDLKLIINNPEAFIVKMKFKKFIRNIFSINSDDTYITYIILFLRIKRKIN